MKRSSSRSSSNNRRKRRSSYGKYESPSPERTYSRSRARSPSSGRSRSRRAHYEEHERYSPSSDSSKAHQPFKVLCVSALHGDASDEVIKDIIYNEYKRYGEFMVKISRGVDERVAYICFKNAEDAREAMRSKRRILIYDKVAIVEPVFEKLRHLDDRYRNRSKSHSPDYDRYYRRLPSAGDPSRYYDRLPYVPMPVVPSDYRRDMIPIPGPEFLPLPHMLHPLPPPVYGPRPFLPYHGLPYHANAFHEPKKFPNYLHHIPPEDDILATRTLFAGNLEIGTSKEDLRRIFAPYGHIEDIDVKRPVGGSGTAYAFVRFKNLDMAHKAKVDLSGKLFGKYQLKIGYGKATPTTRIWVGGLGPWTSSVQLEREFDRFGAIKKIDYDKDENCAYILYDSIDAATSAVKEMRGFPLGGSDHKLRVDFADVGSSSPCKSDHEYGRGDDDGYRSKKSHSYNGRNYDSEDDWDKSDSERRSYERERSRKSKSQERKSGEVSLRDAFTLSDVTFSCDKTWEGAFVLKNSLFPVKFHLTDGDANIIDNTLNEEKNYMLKITQRLHLNPAKLNDVSKQISSSDSYAIFLALPNSTVKLSFDDNTLQTKSIQNLISYLKQKEAAGVLQFTNKENEAIGVLYAFPPCSFGLDLLKRTAYNLNEDTIKKDHLIIVVMKGD